MDIFWIPDPDPHNNRCGSATLATTTSVTWWRTGTKPSSQAQNKARKKLFTDIFPSKGFEPCGNWLPWGTQPWDTLSWAPRRRERSACTAHTSCREDFISFITFFLKILLGFSQFLQLQYWELGVAGFRTRGRRSLLLLQPPLVSGVWLPRLTFNQHGGFNADTEILPQVVETFQPQAIPQF